MAQLKDTTVDGMLVVNGKSVNDTIDLVDELNSDYTNLKTNISNSNVLNMMNVWGTDLEELDFQLYKSQETGTYYLQAIIHYGSTSKTVNLATWT